MDSLTNDAKGKGKTKKKAKVVFEYGKRDILERKQTIENNIK